MTGARVGAGGITTGAASGRVGRAGGEGRDAVVRRGHRGAHVPDHAQRHRAAPGGDRRRGHHQEQRAGPSAAPSGPPRAGTRDGGGRRDQPHLFPAPLRCRVAELHPQQRTWARSAVGWRICDTTPLHTGPRGTSCLSGRTASTSSRYGHAPPGRDHGRLHQVEAPPGRSRSVSSRYPSRPLPAVAAQAPDTQAPDTQAPDAPSPDTS